MGCKLVLNLILVLYSVLVGSYSLNQGNRNKVLQQVSQPRNNPNLFQPNGILPWPQTLQSPQNPSFVSNNFATTNNNIFGKSIRNIANVTPNLPLQNRYNSLWGQRGNLPQNQAFPAFNNELAAGKWNNQNLNQPMTIYGKPYEENNIYKSYVNQGNYAQDYPYYQSKSLPIPDTAANYNSYLQGLLPQNQYSPILSPRDYIPWPVPDNQNPQLLGLNVPTDYNKPPMLAIDPVPVSSLRNSEFEPVYKDQDKIVSSQSPAIEQPIYDKPYIIVHENGTYENVDNLDNIVVDEFNRAHLTTKEPPNLIVAIIEIEGVKETNNQTLLEVPYDTGITKIPQDIKQNTNDSSMLQNYTNPIEQNTTEDPTYDMKYFQSEYLMPIQATTESSMDSTLNTSQQNLKTNGELVADNYSSMQIYTLDTPLVDHSLNKNLNEHYFTRPDDIISTAENNYYPTDNVTYSMFNSVANSTPDRIIDNKPYSASDSTPHTVTESIPLSVIDSTTHSVIDSTNDGITYITNDSATESPTYPTDMLTDTLQHTNSDSNEYGTRPTLSTTDVYQNTQYVNNDHTEVALLKIPSTTHETDVVQQTSETDMDINENYPNYFDIPPTKALNSPRADDQKGFLYDNLAYYEPEPKQNNDYDDITGTSILTSDMSTSDTNDKQTDLQNEEDPQIDSSPILHEPPRLSKDLEIDPSDLKTVVSQPVVWFRPDESFWDKVTKGKNAYDALTIYNINCKPMLIERVTNIHHYANGTESAEYVESIWDSPDALHPREIKAKRVFRDAE